MTSDAKMLYCDECKELDAKQLLADTCYLGVRLCGRQVGFPSIGKDYIGLHRNYITNNIGANTTLRLESAVRVLWMPTMEKHPFKG
jgi:hypothetical protein